MTSIERRIRWHRSLQFWAAGGAAGFAVATVQTLVAMPGDDFAPSATLSLAAALAAAWEWRKVGRLRAQAASSQAEPPKTHAEEMAEAVEALRQRQWDLIADRAYLAAGGQDRHSGLRRSIVLPPAPVEPGAPKAPFVRAPGGVSMAEFQVGVTRLSAALGGCAHPNAEPVDLITGERVAWCCPDCPANLPAGWH